MVVVLSTGCTGCTEHVAPGVPADTSSPAVPFEGLWVPIHGLYTITCPTGAHQEPGASARFFPPRVDASKLSIDSVFEQCSLTLDVDQDEAVLPQPITCSQPGITVAIRTASLTRNREVLTYSETGARDFQLSEPCTYTFTASYRASEACALVLDASTCQLDPQCVATWCPSCDGQASYHGCRRSDDGPRSCPIIDPGTCICKTDGDACAASSECCNHLCASQVCTSDG